MVSELTDSLDIVLRMLVRKRDGDADERFCKRVSAKSTYSELVSKAQALAKSHKIKMPSDPDPVFWYCSSADKVDVHDDEDLELAVAMSLTSDRKQLILNFRAPHNYAVTKDD
jgi:hypothetical protein